MNQLPNQNGEDDMSFVDLWRRAVFADATLNTTTKLVAMALTEYADWSTGRNAWPSNATIASMCSCSTKTVTRARASLSDAGLISVREKAGPGGTTICNLLMSADGMDTKSIHVDTESTPMDTESTPMDTESIGAGHRVHPGGTQSPWGMDTESHNPTIDLIKEQEEEDAREVRACTKGVSEHGAMVNASPSTCRDDVQEQPIREEVSAQELDEYGRPADREFRVRELMRVAWRAMGDTGALRQLASVHRIERGDEDALKRRLAAPLRTIAASADRRIWSRADLEFYLFERVAALDARGVEPSRWMAMLSSRADMDTYEQEHIDPVDGAEMDAGALDGHNTTHDTSSVKEPYRGYYVPPVLSEEEKALQAAQQVEYWQQINSLLAANEERERREQEERAALYAELERTLVIGGRVGGES